MSCGTGQHNTANGLSIIPTLDTILGQIHNLPFPHSPPPQKKHTNHEHLRSVLKLFPCNMGTSFQLILQNFYHSSLLSLFLLHVQIIAVRLYVNIVIQRTTQNKFVVGLFYIRDVLTSNLNPETSCPGRGFR